MNCLMSHSNAGAPRSHLERHPKETVHPVNEPGLAILPHKFVSRTKTIFHCWLSKTSSSIRSLCIFFSQNFNSLKNLKICSFLINNLLEPDSVALSGVKVFTERIVLDCHGYDLLLMLVVTATMINN